MQRRILRATLGVSVSMVVLMTLAMFWGDWAGTTASAERQVAAEAEHVAMKLHDLGHSPDVITVADLEEALPADHAIQLTTESGRTVTAGDAAAGGPTFNRVIIGVGVIRLTNTSGTLSRNHLVATLTIVSMGLVLVLLAVAVSIRTSRRLTEPINELAAHAERLGSGNLRPSNLHYGISELDRLADSMDASVVRVAALLAEERRVSVDASHQLKTPLTALSLRLEELAEWPDDGAVRAEARKALDQVERLSRVVDDLLVDRRVPNARRLAMPLGQVIEQQLSEWRPAFGAADRQLSATVDTPATMTVDAGPVGQVLAALIENSLLHGSGTTTIEVHRPQSATWIDVFDQGEGMPDDVAPRVFERDFSGAGGTGLGLAAAQDAAVSVGGRLSLVRRRPAHFRFFLDGRKDPASIRPESEEGSQTDADHVG